MDVSEYPMVDVLRVKGLDGHRLWVRFSDGQEGIFDLSADIDRGGEMIEPLQSEEYFKRVFVELGVPTWPNGFDIDASNLYADMRKAGLLSSSVAAE